MRPPPPGPGCSPAGPPASTTPPAAGPCAWRGSAQSRRSPPACGTGRLRRHVHVEAEEVLWVVPAFHLDEAREGGGRVGTTDAVLLVAEKADVGGRRGSLGEGPRQAPPPGLVLRALPGPRGPDRGV